MRLLSTAKLYEIAMKLLLYICVSTSCLAGGEESTSEFMEKQSLATSSIPFLDEAYAVGVVEHPYPLNCFLRDWNLGSDFYQAVKIGIVQYMILKMICAFLAMFFEFLGIYGEGKFESGYAL
ncbi:hypothetical protein OROGR_026411 [Orobanche gracilis]